MAYRIIHLGVDHCHRLMVLRNAGFGVEECPSLVEFREALMTEPPAGAICVGDGEAGAREMVVSLARARCSGPLILFQTDEDDASGSEDAPDASFDLVVPCLTPPEVWLSKLRSLIQRGMPVDGHKTFPRYSGRMNRNSRERRLEAGQQ